MIARATPAEELVSGGQGEQIADFLLSILPSGRPRRVARMYDPGHSDKYRDIPKAAPFTRQQLLEHGSGRETWAATLDSQGLSRLGVIEVDAGGRIAVLAVLAAAAEHTLSAFAIAVDNPLNGHAGGHVWFLYQDPAPVAAIAAQLRQVATAAGLPVDSEIWPCNQVIRLPFGYHRWANTRGELLTQTGELVDLDSDLAGGFDLVTNLPTNAAPPALSTQVDTPKSVTTVTPRRVSPGEQAAARMSCRVADERIDTKAIGIEVRERFNKENTWNDLLSNAGGTEMRPGYWACDCGIKHAHDIQIAVTSKDKIISLSNRCNWATKDKALDKFGFYIDRQHNGNYRVAVEEKAREYGLWVEPVASPALVRNLPEYVLSPEERQRRAAEAARKKQARKQQAAETLADVRARSAEDTTLTKCDRAVLDALIQVAGDRGWCRPSKERIAELSGYSLGSVKRALFGPNAKEPGRLEGRYFVSQGDGGGPKSTALRTFLRGSFSATPADEMIHESYRTCDLIPDSGACERRAVPQPDPDLLVYVYSLACAVGAPADYTGWSAAALESEALRLAAVLDQAAAGGSGEFPQVDSQLEHLDAGDIVPGPSGAVAALGGAAYVPKGAEAWYQAMQQAQIGASEVPTQVEQAAPVELLDLTLAPEPAPEPGRQLRRRPREISALDRYRVDLAGMEETALAGELKKHQRTLKKHAGAHWLGQIRAKIDLVQAEIDERELAGRAGADSPAPSVTRTQMRRRRGALSAGMPRIAAGAQLSLELESGSGFALSLIESSPPLTSSSTYGP